MMRTHLRDEFELLLRIGALDEGELQAANERGHEVSFVGRREALVLEHAEIRPLANGDGRERTRTLGQCKHSSDPR